MFTDVLPSSISANIIQKAWVDWEGVNRKIRKNSLSFLTNQIFSYVRCLNEHEKLDNWKLKFSYSKEFWPLQYQLNTTIRNTRIMQGRTALDTAPQCSKQRDFKGEASSKESAHVTILLLLLLNK